MNYKFFQCTTTDGDKAIINLFQVSCVIEKNTYTEIYFESKPAILIKEKIIDLFEKI